MGDLKNLFQKYLNPVLVKLSEVQSTQVRGFSAQTKVAEQTQFLTGQIASFQVRQLATLPTLADAEFRVTSQWGEDGIIEWLVHNLPDINRSFVEFGVENYAEANTRFLLQNRGWRGLVMDGNAAHMEHVRRQTIHWKFDLVARSAFITAENINELITTDGFDGELGILSIDIDGNDYWVLQAIDCVRPAILIVEINGVFGDRHAISVPYDPAFDRLKAHHSGQYFGASLKAITQLAAEKGFTFIGTNTNGVNAFFVRDDLAGNIVSCIDEIKAWPARHRDSRDAAGKLSYTRGDAKAELIKSMPVCDIESGKQVTLESLYPLYSKKWAQEI